MKFIFPTLILLITSCASVDTNLYNTNRLNNIDTWTLDFQYQAGEQSQKLTDSGEFEFKNVNQGQRRDDLQLRDDLYYILKHDYGLPLQKSNIKNSGKIKIHALHFASGGYKTLTVTLLDNEGETIGRLRIENGDRNATYKNESSFTKYAAEAIANVLRPY